ncbi:MAG TPA: 2-oxo acid dehydrogenase subunit E2, partial [Nocardioides sp.]|nr:2-oxo acid dehydrogenase subunit E2 [Nocardioides sp.]
MKEQFEADPASVDPAWAAYFKGAGSNGTTRTATRTAPARTTAAAPTSTASAPTAPAPAAPAPAASAPAPAAAPTPKATPAPQVSPASTTTPTPPKADSPKPTPKDAPRPAPVTASDEPTLTVLRGIPAATAKNMDISLSVPTATSVRNIPVKLLWDNRIVINSHLKRARGGKVSFTHLIGYAIVKAIKAQPAMNNTYDEIDGKPTMVTPAHINLGLAIDQQKKDGTRQLVAPSIKACESMDFAQFWTAYEEIVRKAKDNKLTMEDYSGTTV